MKKRKNILGGSIIAATTIAVSGLTANATSLFDYNNLGTGEEVRSNLSNREESSRTLELKCGGKSASEKKGKEGKCGEAKSMGKKHKGDTSKMAKGKEGKCGEGKCGGTPPKN